VTRRQIPDDHPNVPSLRTLGRAGQQSCAGNDPRLSDARTTVAADDVDIGTRRRINIAAGTGISLTPLDLPDTDTAQVTITATGGGGTLPDDNYGDVTVSGSGTVITINSPVPPARLGTGTADSSTFLRGDSTYAHIETVRLPVKNTSGGTLLKGVPVYATGAVGASGTTEVSAADASNSAKMPAIGLLEADLANNAAGFCCPLGVVSDLNTSGYAINGVVYVAGGGGLTATRPTGPTTLVQNIGRVTRVQASTGQILVMGPGRSNDVPNKIDIAYLPTGATASDVCIGNDARLSDRRSASAIYDGASDYPITAVADGQYLRRVGPNIEGATVSAGGSDTVFANAPGTDVTMTATYADLFAKTMAVAVGDTIDFEVTGTILNNSGAARTYRWRMTVGGMTLELIDGATITFNATNRAMFVLHAQCAVTSTTQTTQLMDVWRTGPVATSTSSSSATASLRQVWSYGTTNVTGASINVKVEARTDAVGGTIQQMRVHAYKIVNTPQRV
jgi:hypothetical protein